MTTSPAAFSGQKWEAQLIELARELVSYGEGSLTVSSTVIHRDMRKVILECGRTYIFYVKPKLTIVPDSA